MKNKLSVIASFLVVTIILLSLPLSASAAENVRYTNSETGYRVVIIDEDDLLSDQEEAKLVEDMTPVTEYGNVAFWSTQAYASDEIDQARLKRLELFEYESASIFVINMNIRKLTIQSYGEIYKYVTDSYARSITDNVKSYATSKDYYTAAGKAYSQMYSVINGEKISEPMKYFSLAVIALMLGVIFALMIAFSKRFNPLAEPAAKLDKINEINYPVNPNLQYIKTGTHTVYRPPAESSSGGGGCGGGGGGGGCGGGGSSSF